MSGPPSGTNDGEPTGALAAGAMEGDVNHLTPDEVIERFRWAKRRGSPAWLWPDVTVEAWREALRRIETVTRAVLSDGAPPTLDGEPAAIGLAAYTSGMGPLLGWWAREGRLSASAPIGALLGRHLEHNRARGRRMRAAAIQVVEAMNARGVAVAVLKGAHTAEAYFPDPAVRPASDIDLLVAAEDLPTAETALRALGLTMASRAPRESSWRLASASRQPRSLTHVHADDPWSIDLHSSLDVFVSAGAPVARLDAAEPLLSRTAWAPCPRAVVLDQPLLLLHLAVHAGSGLQNLTLLRLVELVLVIRRDAAAGRLSWDAFMETGRRTGSLGYAWPALQLCTALAPGVVPQTVLDACRREAPEAAARVVSQLAPATAQRIDGVSIAEHFMWTRGGAGWLRQLASDIAPSTGSWRKFFRIYEKRAWQLIHGTFSA